MWRLFHDRAAAPLKPRSRPRCLLAEAYFPRDNHIGTFQLTVIITGSHVRRSAGAI